MTLLEVTNFEAIWVSQILRGKDSSEEWSIKMTALKIEPSSSNIDFRDILATFDQIPDKDTG